MQLVSKKLIEKVKNININLDDFHKNIPIIIKENAPNFFSTE